MNSLRAKFILMSCLIATTTMSLATETVVGSHDFVSISTYQQNNDFPTQEEINKNFTTQKDNLKDQDIKADSLVDNSGSEFSEGKVKEHKIDNDHILNPFFIISNDKQSIQWLEENKKYLKSIHAVGLILEDKDLDAIKNLEQETHLPLIPANVDSLSDVIGTKHYPVLVYKNWVTQ